MKQHNYLAFTLIEILVVIVIISIITTVAVISFSYFGQNQRIKFTTQKLTLQLGYAQQQAILRAATLSFCATDNSYTFYQQRYDSKKQNYIWTPIKNDRLLQPISVANNISLKINAETKSTTNENSDTAKRCVLFFSTGDITPFTINIGLNGEFPAYRITGASSGNIKWSALS